jgi:hypothetical protein
MIVLGALQHAYLSLDGYVVMCKPDGVPIELNGKRFRRKFGTKSGELNEREVAGMMTREIRDVAEPVLPCNGL